MGILATIGVVLGTLLAVAILAYLAWDFISGIDFSK